MPATSTAKARRVVTVLYDYEAQNHEELTIREGTVLFVVDDYSDPEWWLAREKIDDAFGEAKEGLVPSTYIEDLPVVTVATALYDYEARTQEELSFHEGALLYIYEQEDPEWWLALFDKEVGLVPANYVEVGERASSPSLQQQEHGSPTNGGGDAVDQRAAFFAVLDGLGGPSVKKPANTSNSTNSTDTEYVPSGFKLYSVTDVDKKKKKNNRTGYLGASDDMFIYFSSETNAVIQKWNFKEVAKFSDKNKKGKKLLLEFVAASGAEAREFEVENKADLPLLLARFEEVRNKSKLSGPNFSGPPPIVGGAGGYGGNNNFSPPAAAPPPIAPSPASIGQTIKAPIIDSKIAVALYDYEASNNEELTIRENDNLIVLDDSDPEWTLVKIVSKKGGEGLVPASYIQVKPRLGEEDNLNSDNAPGSAPDSPPTFKTVNSLPSSAGRSPLTSSQQSQPVMPPVPNRPNIIQSSAASPPPPPLPPTIPSRPGDFAPSVPPPPRPPVFPDRPPTDGFAAPPPPAMPSRPPQIPDRPPDAKSKAPALPSRPAEAPRLAPRPMTNDKPQPKADPLDKPKLANVREWTDKSGTFKTEAEYLGIEDGKVMLHKLNGVKIGVPLDKLDQRDIDFLSKMPGNNHLLAKYSSSATYTSSSSNFMPIPLAKPARGPELSSAALLEAGTASDASQSQYTYGGFDWKSWLIAANISPADASSYALKFVGEKMDKLSLADMERDVLRALGVAEGDIIRIRKAIGHMPGIGVSAVVASKINDRENQALGRNLQMLNSMKLGSNESTNSSSTSPFLRGANKNDQIKSDAEYALQLQRELNAESGASSGGGGLLSRKSTVKTSTGFDTRALEQAKDILHANNQREAAQALAAVALKVTSESKPLQPANSKHSANSSFGGGNTINTSSHDPWSVSTTSATTTASQRTSVASPMSNTAPPISSSYKNPAPSSSTLNNNNSNNSFTSGASVTPSFANNPGSTSSSSFSTSIASFSGRSSVTASGSVPYTFSSTNPTASNMNSVGMMSIMKPAAPLVAPLIPTPNLNAHNTFVPTNPNATNVGSGMMMGMSSNNIGGAARNSMVSSPLTSNMPPPNFNMGGGMMNNGVGGLPTSSAGNSFGNMNMMGGNQVVVSSGGVGDRYSVFKDIDPSQATSFSTPNELVMKGMSNNISTMNTIPLQNSNYYPSMAPSNNSSNSSLPGMNNGTQFGGGGGGFVAGGTANLQNRSSMISNNSSGVGNIGNASSMMNHPNSPFAIASTSTTNALGMNMTGSSIASNNTMPSMYGGTAVAGMHMTGGSIGSGGGGGGIGTSTGGNFPSMSGHGGGLGGFSNNTNLNSSSFPMNTMGGGFAGSSGINNNSMMTMGAARPVGGMMMGSTVTSMAGMNTMGSGMGSMNMNSMNNNHMGSMGMNAGGNFTNPTGMNSMGMPMGNQARQTGVLGGGIGMSVNTNNNINNIGGQGFAGGMMQPQLQQQQQQAMMGAGMNPQQNMMGGGMGIAPPFNNGQPRPPNNNFSNNNNNNQGWR